MSRTIWRCIHIVFISTRRYGPLRRHTSSSCGGLQHSGKAFFCPSGKKELFMLFWPIFVIFWCQVVTLVTYSSNHSNFERNPKKPKKSQKKPKKSKNSKNSKNQQRPKNRKNPKKIQKNKNKIQKFIRKNPKISKMVRNPKISKISKNHFKKKIIRKKNLPKKKCHPLSFPILGGQDSPRALQSSLFQNPGGWVL